MIMMIITIKTMLITGAQICHQKEGEDNNDNYDNNDDDDGNICNDNHRSTEQKRSAKRNKEQGSSTVDPTLVKD